MKTKFFALLALVLGMVSCAKDFAPEANYGGEVDFTLAVSAPELAVTRADDTDADGKNNSHNSAYGAIDYLTDADWNGVNLRYILEVYDVADDYTNATPIKDRQVKIVDKYEPVKFELRLAPKRDYHFVVFADFVAGDVTVDTPTYEAQKDLGLHHVIGETLGDITIKNDKINDECTDAYFGTLDYNPSHNTHNNNLADQKPLILKRPYSKVRVVATDLAELNLNVEPASVEVVYTASHATAFNAVNGNISSFTSEKTFRGNYNELFKDVEKGGLKNHFYTADYDSRTDVSKSGVERHTHMTLFTDYILATDEQNTIQFTMTVFDKELEDATKQSIKTTAFNTQIPVQRNYLTTIIGNVLTTATEIEVSIDDNFASELNEENVNVKERILLETLINGGVFDLTEDLTITAPTRLKGDAVIRLNGYTLTYDIPSDMEGTGEYAIMTRIENGASLTFVGEGKVVSDGYIASVNEGGVLNISEGTFETESCTLFQSNGGKINITGGEFKAAPYNGDHRYTINFMDSKKQEGLIEISGGRFYKYNPEESLSENPAMNFCKNGYWATEDGDWFIVEKAKDGWYDEAANKVVAYSANDLLKWCWIVNNENRSCNLDVMRNISLPMYTVEDAAADETYKYTTTPITITDGVPSGSNWVTAGAASAEKRYIDGVIEGNGHSINNVTMCSSTQVTGFIGRIHNGEVHNLTFNGANIYSTSSYVAPIAYVEDGAYITNVHTKNSNFYGAGFVAGISAELQERYYNSQYPDGRQKNLPATRMENCSVDANTVVRSTGSVAGGIIGQLYGAILYNSTSKANVTGTVNVGGLVGHMWAYYADRHAYIINCSCEGAVITANDDVAGIVGRSEIHKQTSGTYAYNFIVGCNCDVTINSNGTRVGAIVSYNSHDVNYTSIYGCYAVSNLPVIASGNAKAETSFSFASAADITAEKVAKMNEGVNEYNAFAADYVFPDPFTCKQEMLLPQATLW